jgi:hypothetical protein
MINWHLRRRNGFLVIAITMATILVLAYAINQELVSEHMYPRDALHENSNLWIRGTVTSIEENHKSQGLAINSYHIFRFYIQLNITEIVWIKNDLADLIVFSNENNSINNRSSIGIGYDDAKDLQLLIGQTVECKGYYLPVTDTPYSFIITITPSINESYMAPVM